MTPFRRTKLLATLGPSTDPPGVLEALLDAGLDAARLNLSHGVAEDHAKRLRRLRQLAARRGRHVPVMADLSGPKIRVGELPPEGLELPNGSRVRLVPGERVRGAAGAVPEIPVPVAGLLRRVRRGERFLLRDGMLRLRVRRVERDGLECEVEEGGLLKSRQGIARPGASLPLPALTPKDLRDIRTCRALGVDFFALSFVRSERDVAWARRCVGDVPLLAKIERPEAVERLEPILAGCAGILVARGDLGVEMGAECVPLIQKEAVRLANARGSIVIVATQMLASMENSPVPTRAEAADVANAVLDGADGLLLTGETAGGRYPVAAVRTLGRIVDAVECSALFRERLLPPMAVPADAREALASAAVGAAQALRLAALVCFSRSGRTVALLSDHRPPVPVVGLAHDPAVARRLALEWGVLPAVGTRRRQGEVAEARETARRVLGVPRGAWIGVLHEEDEVRHFSLART